MGVDTVGKRSFHDKKSQGMLKFFQGRLLAGVINSNAKFEPFCHAGSE